MSAEMLLGLEQRSGRNDRPLLSRSFAAVHSSFAFVHQRVHRQLIPGALVSSLATTS